MEFNKWEHFVNDDCTRSFLSLEVTRTGLAEVFTVHVCVILCLHALRVKRLPMSMSLNFHNENLLRLVFTLSFLCR